MLIEFDSLTFEKLGENCEGDDEHKIEQGKLLVEQRRDRSSCDQRLKCK
jgi:hypothetical protein